MSVLTHEIAKALRDRVNANDPLELIRATEQAVLERLAAGVSVEPEIKEAKFGGYDAYTAEQFFSAIAAARVAALEEAAKVCDDCKGKSRNHLVRSAFAIAAPEIRALIGGSKC